MVEANGCPALDGSNTHEPARGPEGWENWRAFKRSLPYRGAYEVPVYTDSRITGEVVSLGPYRLLNTVPAAWRAEAGHSELAAVLVVDLHDDFEPTHSRDDWETMDHGSYHGGTLGDEIAALIALSLGVRARAGGMTRIFDMNGVADARGKPVEWEHRRPPLVPPRRGEPSVLPHIAREVRIEDAVNELLRPTPTSTWKDADALVRAARSGYWRVLLRPLSAAELADVAGTAARGFLVARIVNRRDLERAVATLPRID